MSSFPFRFLKRRAACKAPGSRQRACREAHTRMQAVARWGDNAVRQQATANARDIVAVSSQQTRPRPANWSCASKMWLAFFIDFGAVCLLLTSPRIFPCRDASYTACQRTIIGGGGKTSMSNACCKRTHARHARRGKKSGNRRQASHQEKTRGWAASSLWILPRRCWRTSRPNGKNNKYWLTRALWLAGRSRGEARQAGLLTLLFTWVRAVSG